MERRKNDKINTCSEALSRGSKPVILSYEHNRTYPITDKKGKVIAVQLPVSQYKKLLELAEEMEEIKAYDRAMKRTHKFIPFDKAVRQLKAKRKK
jgi:hypothetical protein